MFQSASLTGTAIAAPVSVGGGVLMSLWTMSLIGLVVSTLAHSVKHIFGRTVPAQVPQMIIFGVGIGMMTSHFTWKGRSNKSGQYQPVNSQFSPGGAGESDGKPSIIHDGGLQYATANSSHLSVAAPNLTISRPYSPSIRYLKPLVSDHRQPAFHSADFTGRI